MKEFQLRNLRTGELRYLEIEEDDEITACITTSKIERQFKLHSCSFNTKKNHSF